jgi:hypothetical protein
MCRLDMPPDVLFIGCDAGRDPIGASDPLKLRCDVVVVQIGMVTAVAADDLKQIGVTAFRLAVDHADRLAPENHRPAAGGPITDRHACPFAIVR